MQFPRWNLKEKGPVSGSRQGVWGNGPCPINQYYSETDGPEPKETLLEPLTTLGSGANIYLLR